MIAVNFEFNVLHPHILLVKLAKSLEISKETTEKAWELLDSWYEGEDFINWEAPHTLALSALKIVGDHDKDKVIEFAQKHSFKLINTAQ